MMVSTELSHNTGTKFLSASLSFIIIVGIRSFPWHKLNFFSD